MHCFSCSKGVAVEGHNECAVCLAKGRAREKKRSDTRKAQGLCVRCGLPAFPGLTLCAACMYKRRHIAAKYYQSHTGYVHQRTITRSKNLKLDGRCIKCGRVLSDEEKAASSRCYACLTKENKSMGRRYSRCNY